MTRLTVRNTLDNGWLDQCTSEFYFRDGFNGSWVRFYPEQTQVRDSGNTEWMQVDCKFDEVLDDPCANLALLASLTCPGLLSIEEAGSGAGNGSGGAEFDILQGYPIGYDLPDAGLTGFGVERVIGSFEGKVISRPGIDFAKETYGSEGTNTFLGRGTYANPSYLYTHTFANGSAINETVYTMGDRSGFFEILYASYHPEGISIDVYYLGSLIASTCGRVTGRGKLEFVFDPAIGAGENRVMIRIRGEDRTRWTYSVVGPKAGLQIPVFEPGNIDMLGAIRTSEYIGTPIFPAPTHARVYAFENRLDNGQYWYEYTHEVGLLDPAAGPHILHMNYETWENADWVEVYHGGERIATTRGHVTEDGLLRIVFDAYRFSTPVPDITVKVVAQERTLGADIVSQEYMLYDSNTPGYKENRWPCETPPGGITSAGHYSTEDHFQMNVLPGDGVASVRIDPPAGQNFVYIASAFDSRGDLITAVQGQGTQFLQWFKFVTDPEHDFRDLISIRIDAPIDSSWNYQVGCYVPLLDIEIADQTVPACPDINDVQIAISDTTTVEGGIARFFVTTNYPAPEAISVDFTTQDDTANSVPGTTDQFEVYPFVRSQAGEVTGVVYDSEEFNYTLMIEADPKRLFVGYSDDTFDFSWTLLHKDVDFKIEMFGDTNLAVNSASALPNYFKMLVNMFQHRLGSFGAGTRILFLTHQIESRLGATTEYRQYNMEVLLDHFTSSLPSIYGVTTDVRYFNDKGVSHGLVIGNASETWNNYESILGDYDIIVIDPGAEFRQHLPANADIANFGDYLDKVFTRKQSTSFATELARVAKQVNDPKVIISTAGIFDGDLPTLAYQIPNINAQDIINALDIGNSVSIESPTTSTLINTSQPVSIQVNKDLHGDSYLWSGFGATDRLEVEDQVISLAKFVIGETAGGAGGSTTGDNVDYQSRSGTVTIPAGLSVVEIDINTYADSIDDPDETFRVIISNPTSGSITDDTGVGTITQTAVDTQPIGDITKITSDVMTTQVTGFRGGTGVNYPPGTVALVIGASDVELTWDTSPDDAVNARPSYIANPGTIGYVRTVGLANTVAGATADTEITVFHGQWGEYEFDPARTYEYKWSAQLRTASPPGLWVDQGEIQKRTVWQSDRETETIFSGVITEYSADNNIFSLQLPGGVDSGVWEGTAVFDVEIFIRDDLGNEQKSAPITVYVSIDNEGSNSPPVGGGCIAPDTPIYMADGTIKIAERVEVGEMIKGFYIPGMIDESTEGWEKWTTDSIVHGRVVDVTLRSSKRDWFRNYYKINNDVKITQEHHIFASRNGVWGWYDVRDLRVGDKLMRMDGSELDIRTLVFVDEPIDVIIFDVEEHDTYFVGKTPILIHNLTSQNKELNSNVL